MKFPMSTSFVECTRILALYFHLVTKGGNKLGYLLTKRRNNQQTGGVKISKSTFFLGTDRAELGLGCYMDECMDHVAANLSQKF